MDDISISAAAAAPPPQRACYNLYWIEEQSKE